MGTATTRHRVQHEGGSDIVEIGRGTDMGTSSFRVFKVGGGYWRVLRGLWMRRFLGVGRYRALAVKLARPKDDTALSFRIRTFR